MDDYKQKAASMPRIEVISREILAEKQCYQLEGLFF